MNVASDLPQPQQARPATAALAVLLIASLWAAVWSGGGLTSDSRSVMLIAAVPCLIALAFAISRPGSIPFGLVIAGSLSPVLALVASFNAHGQILTSAGGWRTLPDFVPILPSAADAALAWERVRVSIAAVSLAIVAAVMCRTADLRRLIVTGLGLLGLSVALYILAQRAGLLPPLHPSPEGTGYGPLRYHAHATALLAASLPLAVVSLRNLDPLPGLFARLLTVGIFCAAAVATGSRLGVAVTTAVAVATLLSLSILRTPSRVRLVAGLVILAASAALAIAAMSLAPRDTTVLGRGVGSARLIVWDLALHAVAEKPIFGHGPGSFGILLHRLTPQERPDLYRSWIVRTPVPAGSDLSQWDVACNDLLQSLAELGIIGTALILLAPVIALRRLWLATDADAVAPPSTPPASQGHAALAAAVLLSLAALAAHSLADWPLHLPGLSAFAFVLIGVGWSYSPSHSNETLS